MARNPLLIDKFGVRNHPQALVGYQDLAFFDAQIAWIVIMLFSQGQAVVKHKSLV